METPRRPPPPSLGLAMEAATSSGGTSVNCLVSETSAHPPPPTQITPAAPPPPPPAPALAPAAGGSAHSAQHSNYPPTPTTQDITLSLTHPTSAPSQQWHQYNNMAPRRSPLGDTASLPNTTNPMSPRSPPNPCLDNDAAIFGPQVSKLSPKAGSNSRKPRTVGAVAATLGPRNSGVQKRGGGSGKTSALAAVLTLMPYHQYRARQRRDAAMGESVWDDELEEAFMEADATIPKIGRTKYNMDGKLRGRNELIAEFIFQRTGKRRTRKQVSSHIQVLKNLLKNNLGVADDPLSDDNDDDGDDALDCHPPSESWSGDAQSPSVYSEPAPSVLRTLPPGRPHSSMGYSHNMSFASPPPSASDSQFGFSGSRIEPTAFVMALRSKPAIAGAVGAADGFFHIYSQLSRPAPARASPISLSSLSSWRSRFPQVAEIVDEGEPGSLGSGCTMLLMQTSIATTSAEAPKQSLLCTQVELSLPDGEYEGCRWECVTRIYASGNMVRKLSHQCQQVVGSDGQATQKITLPFAPDFWSAFYNRLSTMRSAGSGGDQPYHRRHHHDHHSHHHHYRHQHHRGSIGDEEAAIQGITVVQELFSYPAQALGIKHRSAVLMWEFAKAEAGSQGKAVWREVFRQHQAPPLSLGTTAAAAPATAVSQFGMLHSINTSVASWGELCHQQQPQHQHHQPRLPISPYEDLSPSPVHGLAYYSFGDPRVAYPQSPSPRDTGNPRYSSMGGGGIAMVYPQQDPDNFDAYSMSSAPATKTATGTVDHYIGGNNGGGDSNCNNNSGGMWEEQHQHQHQHQHHHISPVSDGQRPTMVEGGGIIVPY